MTTTEVKQHLRALMNGPVSQSLRSMGLNYRIIFGVEWPRLIELSNEIGKDHELAHALWKEDIRECKLLAALIQPIETFYPEIADIWIESMKYPEEAQYVSMALFSKIPHISEKVFEWIAREEEMFQMCGFLTISRLFTPESLLMPQSEAEFIDQANAAISSKNISLAKAAQAALNKYQICKSDATCDIN